MERTVQPRSLLSGTLRIPGDKSISHRAVLLGALADGPSHIRGFLTGEDCLATIACTRALGVDVELDESRQQVTVHGKGLHGLREADAPLDCGNSGTSMRLLTGLLAGLTFFSVLTGDASLRSRPMKRVIEPLRKMGAAIDGRNGGSLAPLAVRGGGLHGIAFSTPVASAQVKSAVLLAGLYATGETAVTEPVQSRDHTERMLAAMGVPVRGEGTTIVVSQPSVPLSPFEIDIPGDFSTAAFWLVAGALAERGELTLHNVGINPTRTGALEVLRAMGADIEVTGERLVGGEPVADLIVRPSALRAVEIGGEIIPRLIDEVPVLALAATRAAGTTVIRDAAELRLKESDRIQTTVTGLRALGASIEATEDGMVIHGREEPLAGGRCSSFGDHRLAMTLAIAGLSSLGSVTVEEAQSVEVSYPEFWDHLLSLSSKDIT